MKQAIYYMTQKILFDNPVIQFYFQSFENKQLSLVRITFSSQNMPSPFMRMCC